MKKKRKSNISILTIISIAIVLITIIAIILLSTAFTGKAINIYGKECKTPNIRSDDGCCLDENNNQRCDNTENLNVGVISMGFIGPPFQIKSFLVKDTGINLVLKNKANEEYIIKSIDISSCSLFSPETKISPDSENTYDITCNLKSGDKYRGDIKIIYRQGFSKDLVSEGKLESNVN